MSFEDVNSYERFCERNVQSDREIVVTMATAESRAEDRESGKQSRSFWESDKPILADFAYSTFYH